MLQSLYPSIGSTVKYVRQNQLGAAETGSGIVLGITLDANNRPMAHIEIPIKLPTGQNEKINVDIACLNPMDGFVEQFAVAMKEIQKLSEEGNGKVQEIVSEYNKRVEDLFTIVLGVPVVLDELKVETKEIEGNEPSVLIGLKDDC